MSTTITILALLGIIAVLLVERFWDRHRALNMQDMLNRALLAKSVPEYEATAKAEIGKMKLENQNALKAATMLEKYASKQEERRVPIT